MTYAQIAGFVLGNDLDVIRSIPNVPAGQTLTKAWLTVKAKETDADPGLIQKAITAAAVPGVGQITNNGSGGTGSVTFQLTAVDTQPGTNPAGIVAGLPYFYDIKVQTSAGKLYTVETGTIAFTPAITTAIA